MFLIPAETIINNTPFTGSGIKDITAHYLLPEHAPLIAAAVLLIVLVPLYRYILPDHTFPHKPKGLCEQNSQYLFLLISLSMLPASIFGRMRPGGDVNTLSPTVYFLLLAVSLFLSDLIGKGAFNTSAHPSSIIKLMFSVMVFLLILADLPGFHKLYLKSRYLSENPQTMAFAYSLRHPGRVYFPELPLVPVLAENNFYPCGIAAKDMDTAGSVLDKRDLVKYLPENIGMVAFSPGYHSRYVMRYFPEYTRRIRADELPGWFVYAAATDPASYTHSDIIVAQPDKPSKSGNQP